MTAIEITSFGYGHRDEATGKLLGAPPAHLTFDLREHFRDPHFDPRLRNLTAGDWAVLRAVWRTAGIPPLILGAIATAQAYLAGPSADNLPLRIATGCAGGRHRAPATAIIIHSALVAHGFASTLTHRDIDKPVVRR